MRNNLQNDVKIEDAKQFKTKLDLSGSYSSTASIGEVGVAMSRLLQPNTKALCKSEQLVFLAPLVAPTYAKQFYKNWHYFVPVSDIWPNYEAFVTGETISRNGRVFTPTKEPCIFKDVLTSLLLIGAKCTLYGRVLPEDFDSDNLMQYVSGGFFDMPVQLASTPNSDFHRFWARALSDVFRLNSDSQPEINIGLLAGLSPVTNGIEPEEFWIPSGNFDQSTFLRETSDVGQNLWYGYDMTSTVTLDKADFVIYRHIPKGDGLDSDYIAAYAFRLSSFGVHLFKVLRGLGYAFDLDAQFEERSIIPILAAYQAYWYSFGLEQWINLESTYCGRIKSFIENHDEVNVWSEGGGPVTGELWELFYNFVLTELGSMWVTEKHDYVSAHLPQPVIGKPNLTPLVGVTDVVAASGNYGGEPRQVITPGDPSSTSVDSGQPDVALHDGHAFTRVTTHGALDSQILLRMYKRTNANTALGRSIIAKMRSQGLGSYLSRVRTNFIGETVLELHVSSVISSADTYKAASDGIAAQGAELGERGGRGMGYRDPKDSKPLYYKTDCLGYWICLDCVTCDSGYSQAEDITLQNISRESKYQADYDGLGLQLDSKAVLNGSRSQAFGNLANSDKRRKLSMSSQPFGFAPRFSEYKIGRSNLSGGFGLPSMRTRFLGYNMDKLIYPDEFFVQDVTGGNVNIPAPIGAKQYLHMLGFKTSDVPIAGNSYRFLGRYPWMGNLRRIFSQVGYGEGYAHWLDIDSFPQLAKVWEYHYRSEDDYILIGEFWFKAWSNVLPIEETYGTVDPDKKELEYFERV